jgi:2,4-dienoyl-CoA reductase-like NADH-dependent reductase (Old Yellow Enzyme family)
MAEIFKPWRMNRLGIPNRLVRSATWEGLANPGDGSPTPQLTQALADLAKGGVGLIITGYAFIHPRGQGRPRQTGVHRDDLVGPLTSISEAVHQAGGLAAMQIVHAGGQTKAEWIGQRPLGPSAVIHPAYGEEVVEMSRAQVEDTVDDFARAAARVKAAGFDAVQLHGAHGCLINQFLSPLTNRRQDDYGGSPENRARFAYDVLAAARSAVGSRYPLFIKLNSADYEDGGLTLKEGIEVAKGFDARGIDAIEVSGGTPAAGKLSAARQVKGRDDEGYFLPNALAIKEVVSCPVMSVGGWRSKALVSTALEQVDVVALCRPLIRQPDLANRWKASDEASSCISCNQCFDVGMAQGLGCAQLLNNPKGHLPKPHPSGAGSVKSASPQVPVTNT